VTCEAQALPVKHKRLQTNTSVAAEGGWLWLCWKSWYKSAIGPFA